MRAQEGVFFRMLQDVLSTAGREVDPTDALEPT
jgi:hypothetical protein